MLKARVEGQLALQRELRNWLQQQLKKQAGKKVKDRLQPGLQAVTTKSPKTASAETSAFLHQTEQIIREHITDPAFSVEQLAVQLSMSRSTLHRKLMQLTTENAQDIMKRVRLEEAKKLLETGEPSITQVAYAVGYNSLSYFSRAFKEYYGCKPSDCITGK
ncbi:helix-turn-helix transcriptional regulator [Cyclonatronum proteinivorum]|uniref:helix-turn-helix transcriptional regulator n=1 Tax=Cyclonatronum proteinivorum TaxID=1457365 RepID=UPI002FD54B8C